MGPESWTVIGTGIVILIAIAASSRSLRQEFNARMNHIEGELGRFELELRERLAKLEGDLLELRERLAKFEGLFEGLHENATRAKCQ